MEEWLAAIRMYSDLMDVMEITATCDIIPERAGCQNVGAEHAVTDYRDMADYVMQYLLLFPMIPF